MKKILSTLMLIIVMNSFSQEIQLHYDMKKGREILTSTIEMFRPDKLGNTFFFIDMNYGIKAINEETPAGINLAYFEIARVFKHKSFPLGLHLEFNGGLGRGNNNFGFRINEAILTGIDYSWNSPDYSKGFTLKAMYKYIVDKRNDSFQLTGVWYIHFFNKKLTFRGFMDFWRQDSIFENETTKFIFLTEPQLWYNITKSFSVGGEVELSNNFVTTEKGFHIFPTIGARYQF
ncbi:MAG: DUF5020 family protein [Tenacibaculum sp.]|nr:DUF5020 family protein [Tenacibaculum sp.]